MPIKSPYPDLTIPEVPLTPFLMRRAERHRNKPAFIDGVSGRTLTYAEFFKTVLSAAAGLKRCDFRKGDVFAILSPNSIEYAIAFHAVSLLGGTITTMNPLCTTKELSEQLKDSEAKFLMTVPELFAKAESAAALTNLQEIFVNAETRQGTPFQKLTEGNADVSEVEIQTKSDVLALPYSSGTTGFPKGVMLTHYNIVANLLQIESASVVHEEDILICVLPMFHIYGMVVIMNESLYKGATTVFLPRFDLELLLATMQKYSVTLAPLVPPILLNLSKNPMVDRYDLSRLNTIFSAAAPLSREVALACIERLSCKLKQGYGMTEASPATHMTPDEPEKQVIGSVGVCVANTECRIVGASGKEADFHEPGEIWIRGPQIMKGYLNKPEATALSLDAEGWLHTGDIGYADEKGYFFIVDRVKELIKYKGYQVAPAELEAVLLTHPLIADAAVIASPDHEAGEVPKAYVVLKQEVSTEQILAFVAERVAPHKKIRRIECIDQIPKSPSGKILRRVLLERDRTHAS